MSIWFKKQDRFCFRCIVGYRILLSSLNYFFGNFSRDFTIPFTELLEIIMPKSSTNERNVTKGLIFDILLKTLPIYIEKRIGDTGKAWEIPASISLFLLSYWSTTSYIFWSVIKESVQVTKSPPNPWSIIYVRSCFFKTWSNAPFISIKSAATSFFSSHFCWTV